ncbi:MULTISPECIES: shikimate dehydrogenase [unclassified Nitratiruptor]|uniref:shikimate dehydrogenase n=1 Tax=unclassified Nitratiruptor TaxID=2624044 RepID=UPI00191516C6|nr:MULTISPECIES: shikimate dehydrogenase [unclassified Nitratiruptor]BCD60097.1 shikimate dehydrogenase [Nitratiruptor sp. YY08-10]BCD64414.1 shikimate dehydrogenase [Nitratiruptor sp. YY08-14]
MNLYTIFGNPVHHSISPILHNFVFKHTGYNGCYTKILVEEGEKLKDIFLTLQIKGANITVPHKEWAYRLADEVLGIAREIGAVNTWYNDNGKIVAYNTDAPGFFESVRNFDFQKVLILGAGGTAKAIALYFRHKGYEPVILNRSAKRVGYFLEKNFHAYTWDELKEKSFDLVINTTSAGLSDNNLPAPKELLEKIFSHARYAVDVIYNKETPFLQLANDMGLITKDGTEMLLYQGILANEIFTDFSIDKKRIEALMRKSLELLG